MKATTTILSLLASAAPAFSQINIDLGTAAQFALLAVKGVNSTGPSVVTGSIATTGHDILGFPPAVVTGAQEVQNDVAAQAQADFLSARDQIRALPADQTIAEGALTGPTTFTPGVYSFESQIMLVGDIVLSGAGQFFFYAGSHLIVSNGVTVSLADGAVATDVFWAPGDATKIGNSSTLVGRVLTDDRVQLNESSVVTGSLWAESGIAGDNYIVGF